MMKSKNLLFIGVAWILLSGCTVKNIQKPMDIGLYPEQKTSYLFGSFLYSYRDSAMRLALEVTDVNSGEDFLIEMRRTKVYPGLEFYSFLPGKYKITNFVTLSGIGELSSKHKIVIDELRQPFEISENEIAYIGHYDGKTTRDMMTIFFAGPAFANNDTQATKVYMVSKEDLIKEISDKHSYYEKFNLLMPFKIKEFTQQNEESPFPKNSLRSKAKNEE